MASLAGDERRLFLKFITGCPRLPIGGFAALRPKLTVVRKSPPPGVPADAVLPSCSTCFLFLHLPAFSSEEVMRAKLLTAIRETSTFELD